MSRQRTATPTDSATPAQVEAAIIDGKDLARIEETTNGILENEPEALPEKLRPCVKCGLPGWPYCKEHRASYQRDYMAQRMQMEANRGFAKGVEQMRLMLVAEFARLGKVHLSGKEVAFAIHNAPAPSWPD